MQLYGARNLEREKKRKNQLVRLHFVIFMSKKTTNITEMITEQIFRLIGWNLEISNWIQVFSFVLNTFQTTALEQIELHTGFG